MGIQWKNKINANSLKSIWDVEDNLHIFSPLQFDIEANENEYFVISNCVECFINWRIPVNLVISSSLLNNDTWYISFLDYIVINWIFFVSLFFPSQLQTEKKLNHLKRRINFIYAMQEDTFVPSLLLFAFIHSFTPKKKTLKRKRKDFYWW